MRDGWRKREEVKGVEREKRSEKNMTERERKVKEKADDAS